MPIVPRYGGRQVASTPIPTVRHPTDVDPAALGWVPSPIDTEGLSRALGRTYANEIDKLNKTAVTGAGAKLAALETSVTYDPTIGYVNLKGADALNTPQHVSKYWDPGVSEIEKTLTNETQRQAFRAEVLSRRSGIDRSAASHTNEQLNRYDVQQTDAFIANERDAAVAAAVPGASAEEVSNRASVSIMRQREKLIEFADKNGLPAGSEERKKLLATANSATHLQVFERMLANNQTEGLKYYDEMKPEFTGEDAAKAEKLYQDGSLRATSQQASDNILDKFKNNRPAAYDAAKKIKRADVRDAVQARLEHAFSLEDVIARDNQNTAYLSATNLIEPLVKAGRPFLASEIIPTTLWNQLEPAQRNALQRYAGDRENDSSRWHDFIMLGVKELGALNKSEFETKYWSFFNNETRTRAEGMWKQAFDAVQSGKTDAKTSSDETFKDLMRIQLRKIDPVFGKSADKVPEEDKNFSGDFTILAMKMKEAEEAAKGKPLTGTEQNDIIVQATRQVVYVDKWGRDPKRLPGTISRDEAKNAYVPWEQIPPEMKNELEEMLKSAGKKILLVPAHRVLGSPLINKKLIQRLYAARVLNDRVLFRRLLGEF
jgi:hypothetical protein